MDFNTNRLMTQIFKGLVIIVLLAQVTILFGCDDESHSNSRTPREIIEKAMNAMESQESYRHQVFLVQVKDDQSNWESVPSSEWMSVQEHEYVAPDRDYFFFFGEDRWSETIVIGDQIWWRGETSHSSYISWGIAGQDGRPNIGTMNEFKSLLEFDDIQLIGSEIVAGIDCFHLRVTKEMDEIPDLDEVVVDYWVGKSDHLIRQWVSATPLQYAETSYDEYMVAQYFDFNEPIEINPPPLIESEAGELPFPEGTFYKGPSSFDSATSFVAPGSTTHLNEGEFYTVDPNLENFSDEQLDALFERIYAKQAESSSVGTNAVSHP